MKYYFDFDNTLYETARLTEKMLNTISKAISDKTQVNIDELEKYVKENFNSTKGNIFLFAEEMSDMYKVEKKYVLDKLNSVIDNGNDVTFEDAIRFIKKLAEGENKLYILTYVANKMNNDYQMQKIIGSGIAKYFDGIIITSDYKFNLDIDYKNGIFFDDDPRDLKGLYDKNPIKVIRIRKENNKRSKINIENKNIEEYKTFDEIDIDNL